jgi:autotransporter-associated beta strand protein
MRPRLRSRSAATGSRSAAACQVCVVFNGLVQTPFHDTLTIAGAFNTTFNGTVGDGAGSLTLFKTGTGTLTFAGTTTYSRTTTVDAGTVAYNTNYTTGLGLDVADGATARVGVSGAPAAPKRVLKTQSLNTHTTGKLQMNDNDLLVDYTGTSVEGAIRQLVKNGRTLGTGITTLSTPANDTVLAIADNATLLRTAWLGVPIDAGTLIGKYTYFGDANLDGRVTGDDYLAVDANLGIGTTWLKGDFNMDGAVTGDDYLAIDSNLGKGTPAPLAWAELKEEMVALHASMFGDEYLVKLAQVEASGFTVVPEPGAVAGVLLTCCLAGRRRRR